MGKLYPAIPVRPAADLAANATDQVTLGVSCLGANSVAFYASATDNNQLASATIQVRKGSSGTWLDAPGAVGGAIGNTTAIVGADLSAGGAMAVLFIGSATIPMQCIPWDEARLKFTNGATITAGFAVSAQRFEN